MQDLTVLKIMVNFNEVAVILFTPSSDQFDTEAEVVIEANDGTKGELSFSAAVVQVNEETQTEVTLTLNRNRGTFGRVSVYVYASTKAKGAVNGEDFNFTDRVSGVGRAGGTEG